MTLAIVTVVGALSLLAGLKSIRKPSWYPLVFIFVGLFFLFFAARAALTVP